MRSGRHSSAVRCSPWDGAMHATRLSVIIVAVGGCTNSRKAGGIVHDSGVTHASAAAQALSAIVGPIWPHDSTCFVHVDSLVTSGRLRARSSSRDIAGDAFARCVDSLEVKARIQPTNAQREATMRARRAIGLPAEPRVSSDSR